MDFFGGGGGSWTVWGPPTVSICVMYTEYILTKVMRQFFFDLNS